MRRPRTLAGRLFLWQLAVVVVALLGVGILLDRVLERDFVDDLTKSLASEGRTVREALPADPAALEPAVVAMGRAADVRITVIRTDGVVVAESERNPAGMENHLTRPEVQQALRGTVGASSRISPTLGVPFRYVALPPRGGLIVRVAVPLQGVDGRRAAVRTAIVIGFLAATAIAAAGALLVSRRLTGPVRRMAGQIEALGRGDLSTRTEPVEGLGEFAVLSRTLNAMADRLQSEMEAVAEEQSIRDLILSSMEEGILLADRGGEVLFANRSLERLLGSRPKTVANLAPLPLQEAVLQTGRERTAVAFEAETAAPPRWLRGAAVPVAGDGSVLLVARDVTDAKRTDAIRRDFVANASHELKTPAASIRAAAETIRTAVVEDPDVVPGFAEQLEREAVRLSRIVADLLDLSRLESGSELTELVDLDELVRRELPDFEAQAAAAGVTISAEINRVPPVRGSARDLTLLFRNLVDNAVHYTRPGGRVDVSLGTDDGEVMIGVRDTGIGIPSRDLPRIFERFYRVDRARSRETGGTGLGLSIVRHVAENHGGTVTVQSELGQGSTFEVRLPANAGRLSSGG